MPKRKKYPKLPNGYGSIKYLGKGRRNPYAVHPPTKSFTENGVPITPKALCYVATWMQGFAVLTAYHAGNYYAGYEKTLETVSDSSTDTLAQSILANYNHAEQKGLTFAEVYQRFYDYKFNQDKARKYSESTKKLIVASFSHCVALHDRDFRSIRHGDLQSIIDSCEKSHAMKSAIISLMHQLYSYADVYELCDKDYSAHVKINTPDDTEHGIPFYDEELKILWAHQDNDVVAFLLIMCYSGYRILAYKTIEVNLTDGYFKGGVKTASSKNRIVPIHPAIVHLVERFNGKPFYTSVAVFRRNMYTTLEQIGIEKHTPHDCRHTFSRLCEKYGVNENDRKRMMGHSFGQDITNQVYGHRELSDLKKEIEKIKVCY